MHLEVLVFAQSPLGPPKGSRRLGIVRLLGQSAFLFCSEVCRFPFLIPDWVIGLCSSSPAHALSIDNIMAPRALPLHVNNHDLP